jgi:hypothetical protein
MCGMHQAWMEERNEILLSAVWRWSLSGGMFRSLSHET